jgi:hypothetical protein
MNPETASAFSTRSNRGGGFPWVDELRIADDIVQAPENQIQLLCGVQDCLRDMVEGSRESMLIGAS